MILVSGQDHTATGNPAALTRLTMDEITAYLPGLSPVDRNNFLSGLKVRDEGAGTC